MTNYEKYKDEIIDLISESGYLAVKNNMPIDCARLEDCKECDLHINVCEVGRKHWLNAEYKEPITLTEREHAFCVTVCSGWLARDKSGGLFVFNTKPLKRDRGWMIERGMWMSVYKEFLPQFDFIKWSDTEPYSIEELLKLPVKRGGENEEYYLDINIIKPYDVDKVVEQVADDNKGRW